MQGKKTRGKLALGIADNEPLPYSEPSAPYQIAIGQNFPLDIRQFMLEYKDDLALKVRRTVHYKVSRLMTSV